MDCYFFGLADIYTMLSLFYSWEAIQYLGIDDRAGS